MDWCVKYFCIIHWTNIRRQTFFEELLKEQTIVIPGIFFDINPSHRRNLFNSPCHHFVRISFGPPLADLNKGERNLCTWAVRNPLIFLLRSGRHC